MRLYLLTLLAFVSHSVMGQTGFDGEYNQIDPSGNVNRRGGANRGADSLGTDKEIPQGLYVWTIDRNFGDRQEAEPDTLSHMFMNSIFTSGLRGEYNTTGNLGAPRENRIFIDRTEDNGHFIFTYPYSFFIKPVDQFLFTNTLSPLTNLTYNSCGSRTNGEDHLTANFAVNAGKKLGVGFKFDYLYGRGYYNAQSTSHFNYTMYGSYLGDRYQAHLYATTNHQKITENGGITNDNYITHPELYSESFATEEIPTMLEQNWNRLDHQSVFFSHRYSVGFKRKVPMTAQEIEARKFAMASEKEAKEREAREKAAADARKEGREVNDNDRPEQTFSGRPDGARIAERRAPQDSTAMADSTSLAASNRIAVDSKAAADSLIAASQQAQEDTSWLKDEYVPVTSFIHTAELNNYRRIFESYYNPANYYLDTYDVAQKLSGDSIYDKTTHWHLRNTFAISLLEGFNKWAKAGVKVYAAHEVRRFVLPDAAGTSALNESSITIGGQLSKTQGNTLHYHAGAELGVVGDDKGDYTIDGGIDINFPLLGDTVTLEGSGFYSHQAPTFYYTKYQSRHFWWDNSDFDPIDQLHVQGDLGWSKTGTRLRVAYDVLKNYTYFATSYTASDEARLYNTVNARQHSDAIHLLTAEVAQDLAFGPLHWESVVTLQKTSDKEVLPLPLVNAYTNLFLRFKIARVLKCDFGADARYFTSYYAPAYVPGLGQFAVQENEEKIKVGNYPIVNVYANFHLKQTRFFVMMSHVNAGQGSKEYFLSPHNPLNGRILRIGLSWNFFN